MSEFRTRFAPSPTGFLHIGGVRTALVNYLFTLKSKINNPNSKFFIRIEDTDKNRSDEKYLKSIINGLKWLDINWDDKIYKQSENIELHKKVANELLINGGAFKCICSSEKLENKRKENINKGKSVKRLCNTCEKDEKIQLLKNKFCIRLKIKENGSTKIKDEIQGDIEVSNDEIDNFILLRMDGTPTYMLSVVVDDHYMKISHIIRGDDHLNNAFRQYHIYKNLNWEIPKFAHIPLMHGEDGKKLSKRHGAVDIFEFKNKGYLKESILNYLCKLGILSTNDDFFNILKKISFFDLKKIGKSPSRFDYKKLNSINSFYIEKSNNESLLKYLEKNFNLNIKDNYKFIEKIVNLYKSRSFTLEELNTNVTLFINQDKNHIKKSLTKENVEIIKKFYKFILRNDSNADNNVTNMLNDFLKEYNIKFVNLAKPLRLILTGDLNGPSIGDIIDILGKKIVINKIDNIL